MLWVLIGIAVLVAVGVIVTVYTLRSGRPTEQPLAGDEATAIGIVFIAAGIATIPTIGIGMIGLATVGLAILMTARRARVDE